MTLKHISWIAASRFALLAMTVVIQPSFATGLADFAKPQSKTITAVKPREKIISRYKAIPDAVIWHAPPQIAHITNPNLIYSNSVDELAREYLLEGCRNYNTEFAELEQHIKKSNSSLVKFSKVLLNNSPLNIQLGNSNYYQNEYKKILDYINSEYAKYKELYLPHYQRQTNRIKHSQEARAKLEELCGKEAVARVIALFI